MLFPERVIYIKAIQKLKQLGEVHLNTLERDLHKVLRYSCNAIMFII